ncbi:MAG: CDP-alcohol phosphatidyltransferase family protein [Oscillochloris sp.]|nr:CDP-alcohol phosphatidyltransferase family protein [Oscillochloris sp.]
MIDKLLRVPKEYVLTPLAAALRPVHPNVITVAACGLGLACGLAAAQGMAGLAIGLWAVNRVLDGLDGTLARMHNKQSDFGAYLDIVLDHLVYAAVPLGLAIAAGTTGVYLALAGLLISFYVNGATWMYLAALLEKRARGATASGEMTSVTMPGGLIEGAETVVFYTLFLLFPGILGPLFWLMAALTLLTATQRVVWAARHL